MPNLLRLYMCGYMSLIQVFQKLCKVHRNVSVPCRPVPMLYATEVTNLLVQWTLIRSLTMAFYVIVCHSHSFILFLLWFFSVFTISCRCECCMLAELITLKPCLWTKYEFSVVIKKLIHKATNIRPSRRRINCMGLNELMRTIILFKIILFKHYCVFIVLFSIEKKNFFS